MIIFAAMRNPMIHESAAYPLSHHLTKAGAWKAMRKFMFDRVQYQRDQDLAHGGKWMMSRKPLEYESYFIEKYEVLP
jgi:hypothetical protein